MSSGQTSSSHQRITLRRCKSYNSIVWFVISSNVNIIFVTKVYNINNIPDIKNVLKEDYNFIKNSISSNQKLNNPQSIILHKIGKLELAHSWSIVFNSSSRASTSRKLTHSTSIDWKRNRPRSLGHPVILNLQWDMENIFGLSLNVETRSKREQKWGWSIENNNN